MNPVTTILATAAITAGSIQAAKAIRKRLRRAPDHIKWLKKRRSTREDGVLVDLEANEHGVYTAKGAS